jgi:hypothetical protein
LIVFRDFLTRCTTLEARRRVANTLANEAANIALPTARYQKILWPLTPWELDDMTSCEECASKAWPHPNYVVADDDYLDRSQRPRRLESAGSPLCDVVDAVPDPAARARGVTRQRGHDSTRLFGLFAILVLRFWRADGKTREDARNRESGATRENPRTLPARRRK